MSSTTGTGRLTRRDLLRAALGATVGVAAAVAPSRGSRIASAWADSAGDSSPTVVVQWNNAALQAIRDTKPGPPMVARALAIVHTCTYDAWTAYHPVALPTRPNGIKVRSNRSHANKTCAISFAAYRTLMDLFPSETPLFNSLMAGLGYNPADTSTDSGAPTGIGNLCAQAVIDFRRTDGADQLNGYADTTGYPGAFADYPAAPLPVNTPVAINDPNHWQPLAVSNGQGDFVIQTYSGPQWGLVTPFSLTPGSQFRPTTGPETTPFGPGTTPAPSYVAQAQQMLAYSADLTDTQKVIAEYWKDGPRSELPPGHWCLIAQFVSARDRHELDDDVLLFFMVSNAVLDAGIAAWDAKRFYNSVRPITAIHYLYQGQLVNAWGGPCLGTRAIRGETWQPYQPATVVTPPFPEYVSGHSTFSAAAAEVLKRFTGSDAYGASFTVPAGSSSVEPCTPASAVTLSWATFSAAADEAGLSRRYGGIHFPEGDLAGRVMGRQVGAQVWTKARTYINGTVGAGS
ncbi:MAG: vanadium-dependent haloperoxidase [Chloroflexota bacterium]